MNTKIKLKLSLLNVSFLRKNKLTVWLENALNLSYEFFCMSFKKQILLDFLVKIVIQKLMCQI